MYPPRLHVLRNVYGIHIYLLGVVLTLSTQVQFA